ncbi:MAG TPA: ethanolamine permease [Puia sp.]|nr:ethanolamine permease [Puia sp.]
MATLKRSLGPWMLWGLGVGYVISGMYFGWNLGLPQGGTLGLAIATVGAIILYITFTFSYAELACAIPRAGGVFDYATRGLNRDWGFVAGAAQLIEFLFAPPAIAAAIGAYFHLFLPGVGAKEIGVVAYVLFTALNMWGVRAAAGFELAVTIVAVFELLLFGGVTFPHFSWKNIEHNAFPHGWVGVWASVPFAVWFFLGLEGLANVAEEAVSPRRNIPLGFGSALATLIVLCVVVFFASIGVAGWEAIGYPSPGADASDSPLPLALARITGTGGVYYHLLVTIGLMGLIASFHGIILAAGRATLEFGRVRYLPAALGRVNERRQTPVNALLVNMVIGVAALLTGKTDQIVTISVLGAVTLYIFGMITLMALRRKEPGLERPYRAPFYPVFPVVALVVGLACLVALVWLNINLSLIYFSILGLAYIWFRLFVKKGYEYSNR